MTKRIKLSYGSDGSFTAISNIFIDEYMSDANGAYVKVYLYLLRCLGDDSMDVSVSSISDKLDETEKDIIKALKYWEKKNLITLSWDCNHEIDGISITHLHDNHTKTNIITLISAPEQEPEQDTASSIVQRTVSQDTPVTVTKPNYSPSQLAAFREMDDFNLLIDYIEDHTGCILSSKDLQTVGYLFEGLEMSPELIRYLYDYCIYKEKTSTAYIEKVAINWHSKNIRTVNEAKAETLNRSKECSAVKTAFGLSRSLGAAELEYIDKWRIEYRMPAELIREACSRALLSTGKPDFSYTDKILLNWFKAKVSTLEDVKAADAAHKARSSSVAAKTPRSASGTASNNQFNQFPQRTHTQTDYAELEKKKLGVQ